MSRKIRRRPTEETPGGPSRFFIIAIVLGFILFIWMFSRSLTRPGPPAQPPASTSS